MLDHLDRLEYQDPEDQMDRKENRVKQVLLGLLVHRVFEVQMAPLVKQGQTAMMVNLGQQEILVIQDPVANRDLLVFLEYVVFVA